MHIGLFFGTFNPIHTGHLIIANHMVEHTDLDQVWFIVSPHNPFKSKSSLLNEYDRLHLVELAIEDNDHFKASNIEFSLPQPSYTVDTLAYLYDKFPQHDFSLIMGLDNLETLHKWKNHEQILREHKIYVYNRAGHTGGAFTDHPRVQILNVPLLHISATFIRKSLREGRSARYLIPDKALQYINEMHLYK